MSLAGLGGMPNYAKTEPVVSMDDEPNSVEKNLATMSVLIPVARKDTDEFRPRMLVVVLSLFPVITNRVFKGLPTDTDTRSNENGTTSLG